MFEGDADVKGKWEGETELAQARATISQTKKKKLYDEDGAGNVAISLAMWASRLADAEFLPI